MRSPLRHPLQVFEGKGFAGSGHRNRVYAKTREVQALAQAAPENRQGAGTACLVAADSGEGVPKVLGASGFDLDKDELIIGVDCDNIDFAANLFVLQPGGRSPIAVDDAVAVRLKDAADRLFAPASDAVGSGQGPRDRGGVLPGASRARFPPTVDGLVVLLLCPGEPGRGIGKKKLWITSAASRSGRLSTASYLKF